MFPVWHYQFTFALIQPTAHLMYSYVLLISYGYNGTCPHRPRSRFCPNPCLGGLKMACPNLALKLASGESKTLAQILPKTLPRGGQNSLPKSCPKPCLSGVNNACPNLALNLASGRSKRLAQILPISCLRASRAVKKWARFGQAFLTPEARFRVRFG